MSPSHSRKGAARHRYYVSSALIQRRLHSAGSVARVPATKVETIVVDAVRRHIGHGVPIDDAELITTYVQRIEVRRSEIAVSLLNEEQASADENCNPLVLTVPWSKTPHRRHREVLVPERSSPAQVLPIRSDTRTKLVTAIARGRQWLSEIETGTATIDSIATRGLQQAPRPYDDLARLPRTKSRQGRRRRSTATRDRRRPPVRRARRVVASSIRCWDWRSDRCAAPQNHLVGRQNSRGRPNRTGRCAIILVCRCGSCHWRGRFEFDTSRFESSLPSQPPRSLSSVFRRLEKCRQSRGLEANRRVFGAETAEFAAERQIFSDESLRRQFSISEIR
jgi:hypothetical protein